jgi:MFS transporter, UMF1 family
MAAISMNDEKPKVEEAIYRKRIRAWALYDWANSAFATTILAALLPPYFSAVAASTLPSEATATAYWGMILSISTFITAIMSPILGTISDIKRGKKAFLALFTGIGVVGTGLLVFVSTGDWFLAALFFVIGRTAWGAALVFYDALLPHVAREEDQDKVSAQGFALGYLGGGILLAINVAMFTLLPNTPFEFAGIRLSFVTVALWWLIFSIPVFRDVPEPPAATAQLQAGESLLKVSFARMLDTFRDIRQYGELFKYLIAFLIFNDPINTIISMAAIYGAELGFGTTELVLALLLVQFVGIPFTLIFGNLPSPSESRRHFYLAYVVFNMVMLPIVGLGTRYALPIEITGAEPPRFETVGEFLGENEQAYPIAASDWTARTVTGAEQTGEGFVAWLTTVFGGMPADKVYYENSGSGAIYDFAFNGQNLELMYAIGANYGSLEVLVDGEPLLDEDGEAIVVNMQHESLRYNETTELELRTAGQHRISFVNTEAGTSIALASIEVLPAARVNRLDYVVGMLLALQALGVAFAFLFGRFFKGLSERLDTRTSILIAIAIYCIIAVWGYFLNSTIEFWFLAWMVATVQGGSQALSRSLYSMMCPSAKSGEFFGLFSILSKGASVVGTGIFAVAVVLFGSSKPAILSLIPLFLIGAYLLSRVDIEEGRRRAKAEDAEIYGASS